NLALRGMRYDEAEQLYRQALAFFPEDKAANAGLNEVTRLTKQAKQEFDTYMNRGSVAFRDGRFTEAANAFQDALRLFPNNDQARKGLRDAQDGQTRAAQYDEAIRRGDSALLLKRYADAMKAYDDALRAAPGDLRATRSYQEAAARVQEELKGAQDADRRLTL